MTMTMTRRFGGYAAVAAMFLLLASPVTAVSPQAVAGTFLEVDSESGGETQNIKMSMGPDRIRLDVGEEMSLVSLGGDGGKILMIQHGEQSYIELTAEMMQMMSGMMGRMPQQDEEERDVTPPTFTRTGNTKQVAEWSAYEVRVEHPEQDGETMMWFSQDVDADFRSLAQQMVSSLSSIFSNPMMQGMAGGGGTAGILDQIRAQMSSVDIPDGFPVQVISDNGGTQSTNTLRGIDQNASFGPETWQAPAGYSKMDLPFRRR